MNMKFNISYNSEEGIYFLNLIALKRFLYRLNYFTFKANR